MKKIEIILLIIVVLYAVLPTESVAQSITGKAWQSQDTTNTSFKPKTIVINSDETFYQIGYFYLSPKIIYPLKTETIRGNYKQTKDELTLTSLVDGKPVREWFFKINWINPNEFSLVDGNKKYTYAELGSDADKFSQKLVIPYLKKAISKSEAIDPCYKILTTNLGDDTLKLKEEYSIRSQAAEKKQINTEKFCGVVKGKKFSTTKNNVSAIIDFGDDGTYRKKTSQVFSDETITNEIEGIYTQDKNILSFEIKKRKEITTYPDGGMMSSESGIKPGEKYSEIIEWINEYVFRMKLGNLPYLFTASK